MKKLLRKWLGIDQLENDFKNHKERADRYIRVTKENRGHFHSYQSRVDSALQKLDTFLSKRK